MVDKWIGAGDICRQPWKKRLLWIVVRRPGLLSALVSRAGLILVTTRSLRAEIRDIRAEMKALENRLDKRIDELAERVSRLEQSQAHTAGLIEGIRESLFDWARRVSLGDRVAEDAEPYEPEG